MLLLVAGCGGGGGNVSASSSSQTPSSGAACSVAQLEQRMDARLAQAESEVDFSFAAERGDGRRYGFNRGRSTLQTRYESASTSKLAMTLGVTVSGTNPTSGRSTVPRTIMDSIWG